MCYYLFYCLICATTFNFKIMVINWNAFWAWFLDGGSGDSSGSSGGGGGSGGSSSGSSRDSSRGSGCSSNGSGCSSGNNNNKW